MKADRDEASPYAAMLAAQDVAQKCKVNIHVLLDGLLGPCCRYNETVKFRGSWSSYLA